MFYFLIWGFLYCTILGILYSQISLAFLSGFWLVAEDLIEKSFNKFSMIAIFSRLVQRLTAFPKHPGLFPAPTPGGSQMPEVPVPGHLALSSVLSGHSDLIPLEESTLLLDSHYHTNILPGPIQVAINKCVLINSVLNSIPIHCVHYTRFYVLVAGVAMEVAWLR